MEKEDLGAWLGLGIGGGGCLARRSHGERWSSVQFDKEEMRGRDRKQADENKKATDNNKSARRKRSAKAIDDARSSSRGPSPSEEDADDGADDGATRKKLRLAKEQSTLLEDTFRSHNILSHVCLPSFHQIHLHVHCTSLRVMHLVHACSFFTRKYSIVQIVRVTTDCFFFLITNKLSDVSRTYDAGSEARARAAGESDAKTGGSMVPKQEGEVYHFRTKICAAITSSNIMKLDLCAVMNFRRSDPDLKINRPCAEKS
jgi:hypothetical protein